MDLSLQLVEINTELKVIHMVDLVSQYNRIKYEIDSAIQTVLNSATFINGPAVQRFSAELATYLGVKHVIPCANGTDALQIALMALNLPKGSEIISPGFSYAAVAEVCCLLDLVPVFADVDINTFNLNPLEIEKHITSKTKAIIPVHLFGQSADMETIMAIAEKHNLYIIEDTAQSVGCNYTFSDGRRMKAGSIGHIGTVSFFPSKNLGCFGDGGAVLCNDDVLANQMKAIANHGQEKKYVHQRVGINSRLDAIQAAVLSVKLKYLDSFNEERKAVAQAYNEAFAEFEFLRTPFCLEKSDHIYHQYTLQVYEKDINQIRNQLKAEGIPSMVYYPLPLYQQEAFRSEIHLPVTEALCQSVISLPMGTDMEASQINYITNKFKEIIKKQ